MCAAKQVWRGKGNSSVMTVQEVNAMAAKTSVKASLSSLRNKTYPSLGLVFPKRSWRTPRL